MVSILLDTDIDTDCDDAGALACLHALQHLGEIRLLGVICDIPFHATAACVRAINAYYGQPQIPVGLLGCYSLDHDPRYHEYNRHLDAARQWGWQRYNTEIARRDPFMGQPFQDAVGLYRQILASQPPHSVNIVAIGVLTALQGLLKSGPDEFSPLTGSELVREKVHQLVSMGKGSFPDGRDVFNWAMDCEAASVVINNWPGRLVISEWGDTVHTGASLSTKTRTDNPVRRAYEIYLRGPNRSRSSWDQLAVLYAARGPGEHYAEITGHRIHFNSDTGAHHWLPDDGGPQQIYLKLHSSESILEKSIEDLMTMLP